MYTPNSPQNAESALKSLLIIHLFLVAGQIFFGIICFAITPIRGLDFNTSDPLFWLAIGLTAGGFIFSISSYRAKLAAARAKETVKEKLSAYTLAVIRRAAPIEAASLFGI